MKKHTKKTSPAKAKAAHPVMKGPKIMPLGDRVLLKPLDDKETEQKTNSGIFLPDSAKEDKGAKRAKVAAVGDGRYEDGKIIPVRVKVGQTVLYGWGDTITVDGEEYVLVRESEISAVIS
jgi:chaperonin GroES